MFRNQTNPFEAWNTYYNGCIKVKPSSHEKDNKCIRIAPINKSDSIRQTTEVNTCANKRVYKLNKEESMGNSVPPSTAVSSQERKNRLQIFSSN